MLRMRNSNKLNGVARNFARGILPPQPRAASPEQRRPYWLADEIAEAATSFEKFQADKVTAHDSIMSWRALADVPLPASGTGSVEGAWGQTLENSKTVVSGGSDGFQFFHLPSSRSSRSPLLKARWTVLRRLGFGIWSYRRLAEELKLRNYPREVRPRLDGQVYRSGIDDYIS